MILVNGLEFDFNQFDAVMIAESAHDVESPEQYVAAWQYLINTSICWNLQGWFGRTANALIENGVCQHRQDYDPEVGLQCDLHFDY